MGNPLGRSQPCASCCGIQECSWYYPFAAPLENFPVPGDTAYGYVLWFDAAWTSRWCVGWAEKPVTDAGPGSPCVRCTAPIPELVSIEIYTLSPFGGCPQLPSGTFTMTRSVWNTDYMRIAYLGWSPETGCHWNNSIFGPLANCNQYIKITAL